MPPKTILIITNKGDITSDLFVKVIKEKNIPFFRFNTEDFPEFTEVQISLNSECGPSYIKRINKSVDIDDILAVWYRRPKLSSIFEDKMSPADANFAKRETNSFLLNLWSFMENKNWVNNPFSLYKAEMKAYQLRLAESIGFMIPRTLITNNLEHFNSFRINLDNKLISKPISHGGYGTDDEYAIFTVDLENPDTSPSTKNIQLSPLIVQQKIEKQFDVRLTVFGENMFAHKIILNHQYSIDWRIYKPQDIKYSSIEIPTTLRKMISEFMASLNIKFGAFDFIVDKHDNWIFIEINPSGQFAWLEITTGDKLMDALINLLVN